MVTPSSIWWLPHALLWNACAGAPWWGAGATVAAAVVTTTAASSSRHPPPPPPGRCQWCGHCCGATTQVVPPWPATYVMRDSTVLMPCNGTGLIDPSSALAGDFSKWAFASIDWSNGKDGPTGWSKGRPMDAESGMVEQAARLVAANKKQRVGVYRNIVAAQPWFPSVAEKLRDPKYSGWFLPFKDSHSPTVAPRCDTPDPPQKRLCSNLFHGTQQVPRWPPENLRHGANDANCSAPGCDCGGVPCGRYLWVSRPFSSWNRPILTEIYLCHAFSCQEILRVETAGQDHTNASMRKWLIQEHILGQTGIGNPNISAIYLDDDWQTTRGAESPSPLGGPTEIGYPLLSENGTLYRLRHISIMIGNLD
jgi:hypothetical protein